MANRLKWEVRSVIRLSHAEHVSAAESHRQIIEVYGEEMTSRQSVAEGCSDFKSKVETMGNEGCGRPSKSHSASGGQFLNIRHTGQIWRRVIFTFSPLLSIIFLATNGHVMTT